MSPVLRFTFKQTIGILVMIFIYAGAIAQIDYAAHPRDSGSWKFSGDLNLYFFQDNMIALPVIRADKDKLHLEARYNYEDLNTISVWAGFNFSGGKKIEYTLTPMVAAVMGNSRGIAPGLEMTFIRNKLELYSESEYLFSADSPEFNYAYSWTDLAYSLEDWLWVGISAQRTRLYKTNLDLQRGLLIGAARKQWEVTAYLYNLGFDTPFGILTLTGNF